jgi:hypothetical protein
MALPANARVDQNRKFDHQADHELGVSVMAD